MSGNLEAFTYYSIFLCIRPQSRVQQHPSPAADMGSPWQNTTKSVMPFAEPALTQKDTSGWGRFQHGKSTDSFQTEAPFSALQTPHWESWT